MCGICGYVHLDKSKRPSEAVVKGMMDALIPRGPDDEGLYVKENVALGHRRLSIIDLKTGHQPMLNEDGSIAIVYNGEVYNFRELKEPLVKKGHVFKTHSDTEVIIHAYEEYGEECLNHFNGMYALAIWDSKRERLFLARDRFGKKPLYYATFDNQFIFASELKAILKHPSVRKEIDMTALSKYLAYEYVPSPYTIFKNIKKLEPSSRLSLQKGSYKVEAYWDVKFAHQDTVFDLKSAKPRLVSLLRDSVRRRLISDVPLGVFLSGGIDSSSVVAMMAELVKAKDIKTFSIGFKEESYDESTDARRVADFFGTDHHEEILKPKTMLDVLPDIVDVLDEPFADSSMIPTYLVSKYTRRYVTVALGGDAGDELFFGYPSFLAHKINRYLNILPQPFRGILIKRLAESAPRPNKYMSPNFKVNRFLRGLGFPEEIRHQVWIGSFIPKEQARLFLPNNVLNHDALDIYDLTNKLFQKTGDIDPMDRAMYIYLRTYLADDILTKVDRASMANSLEVRAPFLDKDFVDFATAIPSSLKMKGFNAKWILKKALEDKLPKSTLKKSKQGFAAPVAKWLKEDLKPLLFEKFDKSKIEREGIFDYRYVRSMLDEFINNKEDTRKEVWALFMFEMWYDRWMR